MVVRRVKSAGNDEATTWLFAHDTVFDFFAAQVFPMHGLHSTKLR